MMFRNSVRLLLTNFSNVWKLLVYYLICVCLVVLFCLPFANPIVAKLSEASVFSNLINLINSIFSTPSTVVVGLNQILIDIANVITINASAFLVNYIFLGFILVFVAPFLFGLASLALGQVLYGFMTSQVRYGFTSSFIRNLGKSCLYNLVKILFILPINLLFLCVIVGIIKLAAIGSIGYIMLDILIFAAFLILIALKTTFFSGWMPAIVVMDLGPFKALKLGMKGSIRRFGNILSNAIAFVLTAFVVCFVFGLFTFLIAFAITIPLTVFAFTVFQMVSFFSAQGMRFYVYPDMFVSTLRFEEQDTIKKIKYLI